MKEKRQPNLDISCPGDHGGKRAEVREIRDMNSIRSLGIPLKTREAETVDKFPSTWL